MRLLCRPLLAAALSLGLLLPATAAAQQRPGARELPAARADRTQAPAPVGRVELQVMVVYATEAHSNVDPSLGKLAGYLRNLRYTGYELLSTQKASLSPDGRTSFNVDGGRKVEVTLLSRDERRARMRVEVSDKKGEKLLDTTLSVNRNGTFIVAGPRHKDGILVLPLTATY
jgi:hypothetical protein